MARTRIDRRNDFDEFYNNSKTIFTELRNNDKRAEKFEREYMLNICPGSRAGGTDKRIVEVSWGYRNFEFETQGRNWKALTETGATLFFARNDDGYINILIYPAHTDNLKPNEDLINLHIWLDPKKLKNKTFLKSLWNDFIAYMEYTSLDGNPTLYQRLRISYLRTFKHLMINSKWMPTRFSERRNRISDYLFTVGLSGFVFYLITFFSQPAETKSETQLNEVIKKLEMVSIKLDKISESGIDIKTIKANTDSINTTTKRILKTIEKKKSK